MADDALPSWNDGPARAAILDFVARVTTEGGPDYVPPAERIATFDNDGTLWCEQPIQTSSSCLIDRVEAARGKDPTLRERQPFKASWSGTSRRSMRSASRRRSRSPSRPMPA